LYLDFQIHLAPIPNVHIRVQTWQLANLPEYLNLTSEHTPSMIF